MSPRNPDSEAEEKRLEALYRYALLDSPREDIFDTLTRTAANFFGVPSSAISLIDRQRIWFKSTHGVDAMEVDRDPGLCMETLGVDRIHYLEDASLDAIAKDHPLVRDGLRFYAGVPLRTHDGYNIGSICVMGPQARPLTPEEEDFLHSLGQIAINEIERRHAEEQLQVLNEELDQRVQARTEQLDHVVEDLQQKTHERGVALEALRVSEARQRRIAEVASDFCFEVDFEDDKPPTLRWVTGPVEAITGYRLEEIDTALWFDVVHPEDRAGLAELFRDDEGEPNGELEYRFRCKDGSYRWVRIHVRTSPTSERSDRRSILAAIKDMHGLRDAESRAVEASTALERSRDQLRQANKLAWLGTVAAGMAHQVNNPVGAILAAAQFARTCEGDPDELELNRKAMADIIREAHRCGRTVRGILQFSRQGPTPKRPENLFDILESAIHLCGAHATANGCQIQLDAVEKDLPVDVSRLQIEEVLVNVLRNAIDSRPKSPIRVVSGRRGPHGSIAIHDDGCGIDASIRDRVFEPFFTTRLEEGGTGLGLSVAHGIIAEHDGTIHFESALGQGTCVTVEIPLGPGAP